MEGPGLKRLGLAGLLLMAGACAGRASPDPAQSTLRVLTWNIHAGRGIDGSLDMPRIARVIIKARPDLVALQEVDRATERAGGRDLADELASATAMTMVFGQNLSFQGGAFGNAILSRWHPISVRNLPMPVIDDGEQRGALIADVRLPGGEVIRLIATHLDHRPPDAERLASLDSIEAAAQDFDGVVVLAGDLNDLPRSRTLQRLDARWEVADPGAPTFPADRPERRIDYVAILRGRGWGIRSAQVIDEPAASDHRPVLIVLERRRR